MKKIIIFKFILLLITDSSSTFAKSKDIFISHGGRLNSEGCHNDKKKNSYHCHNKNSQSDKLESNKSSVIIKSCYDGDTCTTSEGEKIRLACIDTAELRGPKAQPIEAEAAKDYLNNLIAGKEVFIKRITKDRYGRTIAELFKNDTNVQELIVDKGYGTIYKRYADQCEWTQ